MGCTRTALSHLISDLAILTTVLSAITSMMLILGTIQLNRRLSLDEYAMGNASSLWTLFLPFFPLSDC